MITFNSLSTYFPAGSFEFVGNSQVKLNISAMTGDSLTLDSEAIKAIYTILDSLVTATNGINSDRAAQTPPLAPVTLASKVLTGTVAQPGYEYKVDFIVDSSTFLNNLKDPTV